MAGPITFTVGLLFTEPLLGTAPRDEELYRNFIASGAPEPEDAEAEVATLNVAEEVEKSSTGFHRDESDAPFIYDYQIKGFFKDACSSLRRAPGTASAKLQAHKKVIDGLIFVGPRRLLLDLPDGEKLSWLERPLRAQTPRGERVALARSETAPPGTQLMIMITLLDPSLRGLIEEWLTYGALKGLGQWRNASYGRFDWEMIEEPQPVEEAEEPVGAEAK